MFLGRPSVHASIRDSCGSFMFPRYLQYLLTDFRQTLVTGASRDRDDMITFLGQKVKVQGHAIPAEAHSTRRYRRASSATFSSMFCDNFRKCRPILIILLLILSWMNAR